jgi:tRNA uridine 5-carboxymethylaminomethyl modification enzyme
VRPSSRAAAEDHLLCRAPLADADPSLATRFHLGTTAYPAGRLNESPSSPSLSRSLRSLNLSMGRLKTGTPPRLLRSSIDFDGLLQQVPDGRKSKPFSFLHEAAGEMDRVGVNLVRARVKRSLRRDGC